MKAYYMGYRDYVAGYYNPFLFHNNTTYARGWGAAKAAHGSTWGLGRLSSPSSGR